MFLMVDFGDERLDMGHANLPQKVNSASGDGTATKHFSEIKETADCGYTDELLYNCDERTLY